MSLAGSGIGSGAAATWTPAFCTIVEADTLDFSYLACSARGVRAPRDASSCGARVPAAPLRRHPRPRLPRHALRPRRAHADRVPRRRAGPILRRGGHHAWGDVPHGAARAREWEGRRAPPRRVRRPDDPRRVPPVRRCPQDVVPARLTDPLRRRAAMASKCSMKRFHLMARSVFVDDLCQALLFWQISVELSHEHVIFYLSDYKWFSLSLSTAVSTIPYQERISKLFLLRMIAHIRETLRHAQVTSVLTATVI